MALLKHATIQKMKVLREVRYKQKKTFKKRQKTINKSDEEKAIAIPIINEIATYPHCSCNLYSLLIASFLLS
ncbi:Uncharacterised protein [Streptococcus pneumoniae]|nr:Uncharacterised protein [Streptococcus pneumoniae]